MLQSLEATPMRTLAGRLLVQQILGDPQREPQGKDSLPAWPSPGLRQQGEQLGG
jgi:hypothetical protein